MSKKRNTAKQKTKTKVTPVRRDQERDLEEGLEETFPASDPVAIIDPTVDVVKNDKISE